MFQVEQVETSTTDVSSSVYLVFNLYSISVLLYSVFLEGDV